MSYFHNLLWSTTGLWSSAGTEDCIAQYIHAAAKSFDSNFPWLCCSQQKESWIFQHYPDNANMAIAILGQISGPVSPGRVTDSGQRQWPREKSSTSGQFLNTRVIPWNTFLAPSYLWFKDLNMKRDQEHWHMTTHFVWEGLGEKTGDSIFQKGEKCAIITHTHYFILPKSVSCSQYCLCPQNVLFSIWKWWQMWKCFPYFLIKPPDWSWPPVHIPLDYTNLFLLPH